MELLYDKLYQSAGFSELSIALYLSPLIDEVINNYPNGSSVRVEKHLDDFLVCAKKLQALGIIVNELLTNIMKYAFVDKTGGSIAVSASIEDGKATIVVKDDGKGMPEGVDIDNSTGFGLTLVKTLSEQLGGTLSMESKDGTIITLEFGL